MTNLFYFNPNYKFSTKPLELSPLSRNKTAGCMTRALLSDAESASKLKVWMVLLCHLISRHHKRSKHLPPLVKVKPINFLSTMETSKKNHLNSEEVNLEIQFNRIFSGMAEVIWKKMKNHLNSKISCNLKLSKIYLGFTKNINEVSLWYLLFLLLCLSYVWIVMVFRFKIK